jgi:hypothetical protein
LSRSKSSGLGWVGWECHSTHTKNTTEADMVSWLFGEKGPDALTADLVKGIAESVSESGEAQEKVRARGQDGAWGRGGRCRREESVI